MKKEDQAHFERRLLKERERALKALSELDQVAMSPHEQDGDLTLYPLHPADAGTDTMMQEKDFLLASKEGRLLYQIDDALRTLYKRPDEYGKCLECRDEIVYERLDIVPWARLCIDCQRSEETRLDEAA